MEAGLSKNDNTIPGYTRMSSEIDDPFTKTAILPQEARVRPRVSEERLQVGSVLRDRFMLQERVASGGMGVVYKALDRRLAEVEGIEPWVAIKVLSTQLAGNAHALRALQQEAAKGRCLTHPNIVRFIDFDREDNMYFIVMEWLEGRSLAAELDASDRQLGLQASFDIIRQIGEALAYAHRCGVIHADVKPGNIMVLPSGAVKLFDFGIARVRQQQRDSGPSVDPSMLTAATPAYSSMQVLTGEDPVAADDVFSLACLAYRLIAGHRVFGPRNAAEAAEGGMEPQRPQNLNDAQWKALRKALSHSRVARFASTTEFLDALFANKAPPRREEPLIVPREAVAERRFPERSRRWPYLVMALTAATVAAVLLRPAWVTDAMTIAEGWWDRVQPAAPATVADTTAVTDDIVDAPPRPEPEPIAETVTTGDDASGQAAADTEIQDSAGTAATASADAPGSAAVDAGPSEMDDAPSLGAGAPVAETGASTTDADAADAADSGVGPATEVPPGGEAPTAAEAPPEPEAAPEPEVPRDAAAQAALAEAEGTAALVLAAPGELLTELDLTLTEDGDPRVIDLYRWFGLGDSLTVRLDEVGFSGNRSPRDTGQYTLSGRGVVTFDAGQRRATLEIRMPDDSAREPDQQVSLLLRDYYNAGAELGRLNVSLLDDDQRAFEANHPVNTISFATSQLSVAERDPALQVDVLRLNPDQRTLTVRYRVDGVTATDGEDFFSPTRQVVTFGPGQRNARLLIPLVQDSSPEADETLTLGLDVPDGGANTFRVITVTIRDDD